MGDEENPHRWKFHFIRQGGVPVNICNLAEYKKRKKKQKLTNFFHKYKIMMAIVLNITIWTLVSLKAALLFLGVIVLVPVILGKTEDNHQIQSDPINTPSIMKNY